MKINIYVVKNSLIYSLSSWIIIVIIIINIINIIIIIGSYSWITKIIKLN